MLALKNSVPGVHFEIFSLVPEWFFQDALESGYSYHSFASDVGLVQTSPFTEDLDATVQKLKTSRLNSGSQIEQAKRILLQTGCRLVLCDISHIGIQAAQAAGIASVLIENFTWDFIYRGYDSLAPSLGESAAWIQPIYKGAATHIQTAPVCEVTADAIQVQPVARAPKNSRPATRARLGISEEAKVCLITTGGIEQKFSLWDYLKKHSGMVFVIPCAADRLIRDGNLVLLPHRSSFYHPDLVQASDRVIGKLGYSTVAEVFHANLPYAYIPRKHFPETPSMSDFARLEMAAVELSYDDFLTGNWGDVPEALFSLSKPDRSQVNGAAQIAEILRPLIH
jgi:hypothetical protein